MIFYLLVVNSLFEALTGLVMIFAPAKFFKSSDELLASVARSLGFALLTVSVLSAAMVLYKTVFLAGLIALTFFHLGSSISHAVNFAKNYTPLPVVIIHSIFAVLFIIASVQQL